MKRDLVILWLPALAVVLLQGCSPNPMPTDNPEVESIAADWSYTRSNLPENENAATHWAKAESNLVPLSAELKAAARVPSEALHRDEIQSLQPALTAWIETNRTTLAEIEQSLMLERAVIPVFDANDPAPFLELMMHVVWARNLQAIQTASAGNHVAARQLFSGTLLLLQMLRDANVPVIHYLVACALKKNTERWIAAWAWELNPSGEQVQLMLDSINKPDDEVEA